METIPVALGLSVCGGICCEAPAAFAETAGPGLGCGAVCGGFNCGF